MTNDEINERIAKITGFHDKVGLKKRGLWWRPNAQGYTSSESGAGRYTLEEAENYAHPDGEPVAIHKFTTPNYAESLDACREFLAQIDENDRAEFSSIVTCMDRIGMACDWEFYWAMITLTPLELCEAFLRLKGQWE
ncbi:MAG: hypothetical protein EBR84_03585 [Actinobacteria bacterium]|nr:hypothetical protein [Actinomycetota bacterium]